VISTYKYLLAGLMWFCATTIAQNALATTKSRPTTRPGVDSRTILGLTLGRATLAQVRAKLGPATIWSDGDASTAETKVCYVTEEPHAIAIVFASNAEMAGPPDNEVTDIRIVKQAGFKDRSKCRSLMIFGDEASTASGLKLGLARQRVRDILGLPGSVAGSKWDYSWNVDEPLPTSDKNYQGWLARKDECFDGKKPFFTVHSGITLKFDGDKVVGLSLSRTETIC
jgi:hypothetical protein